MIDHLGAGRPARCRPGPGLPHAFLMLVLIKQLLIEGMGLPGRRHRRDRTVREGYACGPPQLSRETLRSSTATTRPTGSMGRTATTRRARTETTGTSATTGITKHPAAGSSSTAP